MAGVYRFGPYRLDTTRGELRRAGTPVRLRPKTVALLGHLVENAGRTVTKDELLDAVWPDVAVGDAVLKVGVRELREALGDDAGAPRYVATAHRSGYRFVCAVEAEGLPRRRTSFVGRGEEIAAIRRCIEQDTRLLTLTGPGGSGKSRLALEAAAALGERFADGVAWIELATVASPARVARAVADVCGVREHGRRSIADQLAGWLRSRSFLLVLDNCEPVAAAVAALAARLVGECPRLAVLATSREPLRLEGEALWPVPPLGIPLADDPMAAESVRLFVERALAIRPDLPLAADDLAAVAEICRRLDGLPLAIELAAARVGVLSPAEIAVRLDDALRLLSLGSSEVPRHRTLAAAIDWSHATLAEDERRLFRRLAVFSGSFTLEGAAAVVEESAGAPGGDALDLLRRLIEKSLVGVAGRGPGGTTRYRLLEVVRQYAEAKLDEEGERDAVTRRHGRFFADLAEREDGRINGRDRVDALARLDADVANIRAALERGLAAADREGVERARRIAAALVWYWFYRGFWGEARETIARVREVAAGADDALAATAAFGDGLVAWIQGENEEAASALAVAATTFRRLGDEVRLGRTLNFESANELGLGRLDRALTLSEEAVRLLERHREDPFGYPAGFANRGIVLMAAGDLGRARESLERAEKASRKSGESWILSLAVRNLGLLDAREGDLRRAAERIAESLALLVDLGERWFVSRAIEMLASVRARLDDAVRAARLYGAGEALREEIGASVLANYRDDYEVGITMLRAQLGSGRLRREWAAGRRLGFDQAIGLALDVAEVLPASYDKGATVS